MAGVANERWGGGATSKGGEATSAEVATTARRLLASKATPTLSLSLTLTLTLLGLLPLTPLPPP